MKKPRKILLWLLLIASLSLTVSCKKNDKEPTESKEQTETTVLEKETEPETTTVVEITEEETIEETVFEKDSFVEQSIEITLDNFNDSQRLENVSKGQLVYFSGFVSGHSSTEKDDYITIDLSENVDDKETIAVTCNNVDLTQFNDDDVVTVYGEYVGEIESKVGTVTFTYDNVVAKHIVVTGKADIYGPEKKFFEADHNFPTPVYLIGTDKVKYDSDRSSYYQETKDIIYTYCSTIDSHDFNESLDVYKNYCAGLLFFGYEMEVPPKYNGRMVLNCTQGNGHH